ncbi:MAG TPA: hypothetical protein VMC06_13540 [Opitutaceae bacterium]|nr:hypothetical protein [Opitutaceae bacterium]
MGNYEKLRVLLKSNSIRWWLIGRPSFALMGHFACKKLLRREEAAQWKEICLKLPGASNRINGDTLNNDDAKELEAIFNQEFVNDPKVLYGRNAIGLCFANILLFCITLEVSIFLLAKLNGR